MDNILPNTDFTEFENRVYLNPQVGLDESNTFIDNLRSTQGQQNQEIFADTQRLGTNVPSDIGGLTGANSYFTSRYQTPQTNAAVSNLRATAQAKALNDVLANEQAIWKKRYQDAYRAYQKRSFDKSYNSSGAGGSGGNNDNTSSWNGEIEDVITNDSKGGLTAVGETSLDANDIASGGTYTVDPVSGNIIWTDSSLSVDDPNYQKIYYKQPDGSYVSRDGERKAFSGVSAINNDLINAGSPFNINLLPQN